MMVRYLGPGLLGLGVTALIAGFMSGMAGNVSAFSTVWTYDIYGAFLNKRATDAHYVRMGRACTLIGVLVSIGTAYLVQHAASIMDYVQQLFSFFIAPLFGTVILGMLWKRATKAGGFWGLLGGTVTSIGLWIAVRLHPEALRYVALSPDAKPMAETLYRALWSWIACVVITVAVSLVTRPRPVEELEGLVYGISPLPKEPPCPWYHRPVVWAAIVGTVFIGLNIVFW
jgi:SSS family solute:Na+ symporter